LSYWLTWVFYGWQEQYRMGIELIVFATVFTLIVLLTGGPGNGAI
jgi:hypothetical protein